VTHHASWDETLQLGGVTMKNKRKKIKVSLNKTSYVNVSITLRVKNHTLETT
jgi:hypothetical protein